MNFIQSHQCMSSRKIKSIANIVESYVDNFEEAYRHSFKEDTKEKRALTESESGIGVTDISVYQREKLQVFRTSFGSGFMLSRLLYRRLSGSPDSSLYLVDADNEKQGPWRNQNRV